MHLPLNEDTVMPETHTLRLHIEYDLLYMADLRAILRLVERAYNAVGTRRSRGRPAEPLIIETARTGNSITLMAIGGVGLVFLGKLVAGREAFWKSEKVKWEAKSARLDYEEKLKRAEDATAEQTREEGATLSLKELIKVTQQRLKQEDKLLPTPQDGPEVRAAIHIERLITLVDRSEYITFLGVEIDGDDNKSNSSDRLANPVEPKPPEGQKFR
jgi:hypothetical protein